MQALGEPLGISASSLASGFQPWPGAVRNTPAFEEQEARESPRKTCWGRTRAREEGWGGCKIPNKIKRSPTDCGSGHQRHRVGENQ